MIQAVCCPVLSAGLLKLKEIIAENERAGKKTIVFCEDRLTLVAERTICSAVGGSFSSSVYTFARFLSSERGRIDNLLSSQGSAMAIRAIIEENRDKLLLFGRFAPSAAAGAVYDTIALLYSSGLSPDDVKSASTYGLLESKLHDIGVIYEEYNNYLEKNNKVDRNAYLATLPAVIENSEKIKESEVIFLGFQSFTHSALECVRATFKTAKSVCGLFIGGSEEIYVKEALASFTGTAEKFGGAKLSTVASGLIPEAEALRVGLFDAESYCNVTPCPTKNVHIFEAGDENEELEFIAASIKKHVLDGERYSKISVMIPSLNTAERELKRVFAQYKIPYYADRRYTLSEHPISEFVIGYLMCAQYGCRMADCDRVISSPLFPAEREDKDNFRNYALRLAKFRGGIKREPKREICEGFKFDYDGVQRVRKAFLECLECIPQMGGRAICEGVKKLLEKCGAPEKLDGLYEKFKDSFPVSAEFSKRVYGETLSVLDEAEGITGDNMPLGEVVKILKSGFSALEISLIPPKSDAVFVGDLSATSNIGSNVVFVAHLTGDVPAVGADTALLTDREIAELEKVNINISPKIRQVNLRARELCALNICAFRKELYLSYPVRLGGEESGVSEIISYAQTLLVTPAGTPIKAIDIKRLEKSERALAYYCSEKLPAIKRLNSNYRAEAVSAVYSVLSEHGYSAEADAVILPPKEKKISDGRALYVSYNSISPTMLETYFTCPYRSFMQQGLKLKERDEGVVRPVDSGNFIHTVLETLAPEVNTIEDEEKLKVRATEVATELLSKPPYSSLADSKSGAYTAEALKEEATEVSDGMFKQLKNSRFKVESAESKCDIPLKGGVKLYGRIDRVDSSGDMVRVVDYKTGTVDSSPTKYYMGLKLQLPIYLLYASKDRRAVGTYYFPASVEYKDEGKKDGVFRLQGFMDGSEEVVTASDITVEPKCKSEYIDAYLNGRRIDTAMPTEHFQYFLRYSTLIAEQGAREMLDGNITPSPVVDACKYCKVGGSCGFAVGLDGAERDHNSVKCEDIAEVVAKKEQEK